MKLSLNGKAKNNKVTLTGILILFLLSILCASLFSCRKFLDVEVGNSQIVNEAVFSNDITATAAMTGVYSDMYSKQTSFASGSSFSISLVTGLSSDELNYLPISIDFQTFQTNSLVSPNSNILNLWKTMYYAIYGANSVLEGLEKSTGVGNETKQQLQGEAYFIRAFSHFYLVNLFGEVPIVTTTNYQINAQVKREPVSKVYGQIVTDLLLAQTKLATNYTSTGRVRPNRAAATAFLARVYLYLNDWPNAEIQATAVINDSRYALEVNLDEVFLHNSDEAIWQLMPNGVSNNTWEGFTLILTSAPISVGRPFHLTDAIVNGFETNDLRRIHWVSSINAGVDYYFPFKYKKSLGGTGSNPSVPLTEYSAVLRLAEQFLIRAEARAQQGNLAGSITDINKIRSRAGLSNTTATNKDALLNAIIQERRNEFFTEWGHRWLDLKRWNIAGSVLGPLKGSNWQATDTLYPIPQTELDKNPYLGSQNPGY